MISMAAWGANIALGGEKVNEKLGWKKRYKVHRANDAHLKYR